MYQHFFSKKIHYQQIKAAAVVSLHDKDHIHISLLFLLTVETPFKNNKVFCSGIMG